LILTGSTEKGRLLPTPLPKQIDYRGLDALQEQNDREGRRLLEEALNGRFYTDEGLLYT
jgi:hypothetical protein